MCRNSIPLCVCVSVQRERGVVSRGSCSNFDGYGELRGPSVFTHLLPLNRSLCVRVHVWQDFIISCPSPVHLPCAYPGQCHWGLQSQAVQSTDWLGFQSVTGHTCMRSHSVGNSGMPISLTCLWVTGGNRSIQRKPTWKWEHADSTGTEQRRDSTHPPRRCEETELPTVPPHFLSLWGTILTQAAKPEKKWLHWAPRSFSEW